MDTQIPDLSGMTDQHIANIKALIPLLKVIDPCKLDLLVYLTEYDSPVLHDEPIDIENFKKCEVDKMYEVYDAPYGRASLEVIHLMYDIDTLLPDLGDDEYIKRTMLSEMYGVGFGDTNTSNIAQLLFSIEWGYKFIQNINDFEKLVDCVKIAQLEQFVPDEWARFVDKYEELPVRLTLEWQVNLAIDRVQLALDLINAIKKASPKKVVLSNRLKTWWTKWKS